MPRWTAFRRDQGGNTAVEFAFLVPLLLLLVSGLIDFGRAFFTTMELENSARAGAQYAIVHGADNLTTIENVVYGASSVAPADLTVNATTYCGCPDGTVQPCTGGDCGGFTPGTFVSIVAQTNYTPLFPFRDAARPVTITGTAQIRVE